MVQKMNKATRISMSSSNTNAGRLSSRSGALRLNGICETQRSAPWSLHHRSQAVSTPWAWGQERGRCQSPQAPAAAPSGRRRLAGTQQPWAGKPERHTRPQDPADVKHARACTKRSTHAEFELPRSQVGLRPAERWISPWSDRLLGRRVMSGCQTAVASSWTSCSYSRLGSFLPPLVLGVVSRVAICRSNRTTGVRGAERRSNAWGSVVSTVMTHGMTLPRV